MELYAVIKKNEEALWVLIGKEYQDTIRWKKRGGQGYRIACYQLCLKHTHTPICTQIPWKDAQALGTVGASGETGRPWNRGGHKGNLFFHLSCASRTYSGINVSLDKHNVKFPGKDTLTSEL